MSDTAGDVQSAEQSARELLRVELGEVLKPYEFYRLVNVLSAELLVGDVEPAEVVDVLVDRELLADNDVLHDYTDILFDVVADGSHFLAEYLDIALVK